MYHMPAGSAPCPWPGVDPPASTCRAAAPGTGQSPFAAPAASGLQRSFTPLRPGSDSVRRRKSASCSALPGNPWVAAPGVVEVAGRAGGVIVLVVVPDCALSPTKLSSSTSTVYLAEL